MIKICTFLVLVIVGTSGDFYTRGIAAARLHDFKKAEGFFRSAIANDPTDFLANFDLGGLYEEQSDKKTALQYYLKAAELKPNFVEAQAEIETLYLLDVHDYQKAIAFGKIALLTKEPFVDPRFPLSKTRAQVFQNLAVAYAMRGMPGIARDISESALADPNIDHAQDGKLKAINNKATKEMRFEFESRKDLRAIGKTLHGGHPKEAISAYKAFDAKTPVSSLKPFEQWDYHEGLGIAHLMLRDFESALPELQSALIASRRILSQYEMESLYNVACALSRLQRVEEALSALDELLWLEQITQYTLHWKKNGAKHYLKSIETDEDLAEVRQSPGFQLLSKYW